MKYKPQLTTFFDILGFRQLIATKTADEIAAILRKVETHAAPDKENRKLYEMGVVSFSDSIVRAVHILSKANLEYRSGILYYELFDLAFVQSLLVYEDSIFLRGAI